MAVQTGVINGTKLVLFLNGETAILSTNLSWNTDHKVLDGTCRESNGWNLGIAGGREWSVDCENMVAFRNDSGILYNAVPGSAAILEIISKFIIRQQKVKIKVGFAGNPSNNPYWSGKGYITSVSLDAPNEDNSTFSMSLSGTGEWRKGFNGLGN
jgi:predicted secreted protein